jgi:hypothetical protein
VLTDGSNPASDAGGGNEVPITTKLFLVNELTPAILKNPWRRPRWHGECFESRREGPAAARHSPCFHS